VTVLNILNYTVSINVVEFQRHKKCLKNISQIQGFITSKERINANDYFGSARKGAATVCSNVPVQDLSDDVRVLNDAFFEPNVLYCVERQIDCEQWRVGWRSGSCYKLCAGELKETTKKWVKIACPWEQEKTRHLPIQMQWWAQMSALL